MSVPTRQSQDAKRSAKPWTHTSVAESVSTSKSCTLAVDGDVVLMERDDHWIVNGKEMHWPVMGAYEVKDQKITAWREYFTPVRTS
jgi:limonene-1,2-epoxide hydrolase